MFHSIGEAERVGDHGPVKRERHLPRPPQMSWVTDYRKAERELILTLDEEEYARFAMKWLLQRLENRADSP